MSEKRFEEQNLENHLNRIYDTKKGNVVFDEDIVDLLNELAEEKELWKRECKRLKGLYYLENKDNNYIIQDLQNEDEYQLGFVNCDEDVFLELINQLSDENEQLKQSYKEFEDECQSTFNAMSRKQNDLYRKNFKLKEENEQLKQQCKDFMEMLDDMSIAYLVNDGLEEILND